MNFSWQIQSNPQKHSPLWFLGLGLSGLCLFIFAFWQKNFIFAILTILLIFVIYQFGKPVNGVDHFLINEQGLGINKTFYPYEFLKSFWIFYEPQDRQELSIESRKMIMPYIKIPLANQDPNKIREVLIRYLPEKRQEESLLDVLSHRLGF